MREADTSKSNCAALRGPDGVSFAAAVREQWDVAIVGAGPAGATAALHLAQRGRRVLLLDRYSFPRDKVCGDGLIPDAIHALKRAGLFEEVRSNSLEMNTGEVFSPSRIHFLVPGHFLTIKRFILDNLIVKAAVNSGARFCKASVTRVEAQPDGSIHLSVEGEVAETAKAGNRSRETSDASCSSGADGIIKASVVLLATGASVELPSKLGLVERSGPGAIALRCYIKSRFALDRLVISYDRSIAPGYAWIFPLRDGEFNVGCGIAYRKANRNRTGLTAGVNLREAFDTFLKTFPLAVQLMSEAESVTPIRGAMLRCGMKGARPRGPGNILVIGESIGATFPFTGEGIGKAMETGEIAAEVVDEALASSDFAKLSEYEKRVEQELKPKFLGYQIAEDWFSRPWLNDFLARRVKRSRFMHDAVTRIVSETLDPREVFSIRGVLRSLVS